MRDAICSGDTATLVVAIAEGEDANAVDERSGWSGLMLAAEYDQPDSMAKLLAAGADPRYAMTDGWTALHHAVDSECDVQSQGVEAATGRLVALLVAAGADPDAIWQSLPSRLESPRTMAACYDYHAVVTALDTGV